MRANGWSLGLAIALFAVATIAWLNPYGEAVHRWEATLAVALVALYLLVQSARSLARRGWGQEGFAALGALGGVVTAIAFVSAELLVGPPQRVGGAPGQTYRPPHSAQLALEFPHVNAADLRGGNSPNSIDVLMGNRRRLLSVGQELRVHAYVLRARSWPAAYVQAWSLRRATQTVTQPQGVAFVSPVLQFPNLDSDNLPIDSFAVPALHREVHTKYYPGLPSRGIDVPFVQFEIDEENGGALFSGVAVSGRPVKQAGIELVFNLGTYPVVLMAGAPDRLPYVVGALLIAAGIIGFVATAFRTKDGGPKNG